MYNTGVGHSRNPYGFEIRRHPQQKHQDVQKDNLKFLATVPSGNSLHTISFLTNPYPFGDKSTLLPFSDSACEQFSS